MLSRSLNSMIFSIVHVCQSTWFHRRGCLAYVTFISIVTALFVENLLDDTGPSFHLPVVLKFFLTCDIGNLSWGHRDIIEQVVWIMCTILVINRLEWSCAAHSRLWSSSNDGWGRTPDVSFCCQAVRNRFMVHNQPFGDDWAWAYTLASLKLVNDCSLLVLLWLILLRSLR